MLKGEAEYIKKAKAGDIEAFEILLSHYEQNIYTICLKMLRHPEEAYDVAQDVCIKIWKQLERFEERAKLSTWIYRLTTNTCIDYLRQQKKHQEVLYDLEDKDEVLLAQSCQGEDVALQVENKHKREILTMALDELRPEYKAIIILRDIEECSYEEIGEILNLSIGTVKSRLSRARNSLRKILGQNKEPYCSFFRQKR